LTDDASTGLSAARSSEPDTAVLLVGGLGTRLRPLTEVVPKPLVPVANRPLVWYPIEMLRQGGIRKLTLACGYRTDRLREGLQHVVGDDTSVRVVEEKELLGTAGGVRNAAQGVSSTFIAMNGDQIVGLDVPALLAAHRAHEAAVTLVLRPVADISPYGLVLCDGEGRVTGFREKVDRDPTGRNLINAGIYVFEPQVLEAIPEGQVYSNEYDLFPRLVAEGERVYAHLAAREAYWADVGTPANYLAANDALLGGALPWAPPVLSESAEVAADAEVVRPVSLAAGCRIASGARVGPGTSVGEDARIGAGAEVRRSIIWPDAEIGEGAQLDQMIVGPGHIVPPGMRAAGPAILVSTETH
jgi:mannose-1-phosphate guanylyltransferase